MRLSLRLSRRELILLGLAFNIVAALLSNFYIDKKLSQSHALQQQIAQQNRQIEQTWLQVRALESKRELLLLLFSSNDEIPSLVQRMLAQNLSDWSDHNEVTLSLANLPSIDGRLLARQALMREKIDDLYLHNLALSSKQQGIDTLSSRVRNIAIFLQILGLALILSRDLSRT